MRSPSTFTAVLHRSRNQSNAASTPTSPANSSSPAACKTMSIVTKPALGMAAAPTAAIVAVNATTSVPPIPKCTPCSCAMNNTVRDSYNAVPFMLTVAPSGRAKSASAAGTPNVLAHRLVTGREADDESVANAVTNAGAPRLNTAVHPGVSLRPSIMRPPQFLVANEYMHGKTHPPCTAKPSNTAKTYLPSAPNVPIGSHEPVTRPATSENTPSGIHEMAQPTATSMTAFNEPRSAIVGADVSPGTALNAAPNMSDAAMTPSMLPPDAALTMLSGTKFRAVSRSESTALTWDRLAAASSGTESDDDDVPSHRAPSMTTPTPGWMIPTMMSPSAHATNVVTA